MSNMLEAALRYAVDLHWPVFPCNSAKEPIGEVCPNGVLDATTDPARIAEWWGEFPRANIGLDVGGAGMMVLDADEYKDAYDADAVAGLRLPATLLRARSPRGGSHSFYALAPGEVVAPSSSKLAPGVDVRSFHSYVLLPPSTTADGAYTWEGTGKPAFRTDDMVRLANSAREKSRDRDNWLIEPDLPQNVAAATDWLKTEAKVAVEGQGGDALAYATAAHMKSFGISEPMAFDLIWQHWNPRCNPPWGADEAEHLELKVRNGYAYNTSPPGNLTGAYRAAKTAALFKPVAAELDTVVETDEGMSGTAGRFRFADRRAMRSIEPPTWLVDGFIPEKSYVLISAAPGSFKSFIALDIALTICAGICENPVWTAMASGRVLYMAGEGRSQLTKRVAAWEAEHYHGAEVDGFILADPIPNVLVDDDWTAFIAGAKGMSPDGYKLAVLDTAGRAMQGVNENSQEHASRLTQRVEQLQRELGCAVAVIHHSGHGGDRARGSSVFGADADVVVVAERAGKDMSVSLRMEKQKDAPEWDRPKRVGVREIALGEGITSLAAVAHVMQPGDAAEPQQRARRAAPAEDPFVPQILDKALVAVLAGNPTRQWSTRDIAEALAMRPEVRLPSNMLRLNTLVALREDAESHANKAYCPETKKWVGRRLKA